MKPITILSILLIALVTGCKAIGPQVPGKTHVVPTASGYDYIFVPDKTNNPAQP